MFKCEFKKVEGVCHEEFSEAYEEERQKWIRKGYDWYEFCKMVIDKKRKITEDTYRKLVEEGFQLLDEECYNEKFIWQTLVKVSIEFGTSERILKILQSDKNGDIETIRISHLLSEVDEETFLLEKADTILQ